MAYKLFPLPNKTSQLCKDAKLKHSHTLPSSHAPSPKRQLLPRVASPRGNPAHSQPLVHPNCKELERNPQSSMTYLSNVPIRLGLENILLSAPAIQRLNRADDHPSTSNGYDFCDGCRRHHLFPMHHTHQLPRLPSQFQNESGCACFPCGIHLQVFPQHDGYAKASCRSESVTYSSYPIKVLQQA